MRPGDTRRLWFTQIGRFYVPTTTGRRNESKIPADQIALSLSIRFLKGGWKLRPFLSAVGIEIDSLTDWQVLVGRTGQLEADPQPNGKVYYRYLPKAAEETTA